MIRDEIISRLTLYDSIFVCKSLSLLKKIRVPEFFLHVIEEILTDINAL